MRKLILGTAGHIDHGKTALVRALTGVDTDRLPEEKRRGITIDLGFAPLTLPSGAEIGIVDVPGHEAFVRNMLAGATGVDIALLVVAADESVMPQTREHLAILELLGVRAGVVALSKVDLVDDQWLQLVRAEVRETIAGGPLETAPIVPVSARASVGLAELTCALDSAAQAAGDRERDDLFRLPIDRVFTVRGTGTVVTGTVWSGTLAREQTVRLLPSERALRVRGVQAFGHEREHVTAGERAAIALASIAHENLARGDVLVQGGGWRPSLMITGRIRVLPGSSRPLRARQRVRFHLATAEVLGRIALLEGDELPPGEEAWAQLRLETPVVARAGDRFVLRSYSPVTTIGGGIVAEPAPAKRKRLAPADREELVSGLFGEAAETIASCVRRCRGHGIEAERLPIVSPQPLAVVQRVLASSEAFVDLDGLIVHRTTALEYRAAMLDFIDGHHQLEPLSPGIGLDELRRRTAAETARAVFDWALGSLVHENTIVTEGAHVRRYGFSPSLNPDQLQTTETIVAVYQRAALTPPALGDLPQVIRDRPDLEPLLRHLERQRDLVYLAPGQWIAGRAVEQAAHRVRTELPPGARSPGDFKHLFGISRKHLIPLLEYFDRTGVTIRRGDLREVAPPPPDGRQVP